MDGYSGPGRRGVGIVRAGVGRGVAEAGRGDGRQLSLAGAGSDAFDVGQGTVHVRDGGARDPAQRHPSAGGGYQQRSGTDATWGRPGAGHGADKQDTGWCPASNDCGERVGIAAAVFAVLHAGQRRGRSRALVKDRPQLLPEALAEAQTLRRGAARSRSCAPTTRQLAPAVPRPFPHKPSEDASLRRQEYHNQTPRSLSCVTHPETPRPSRAARRDLEYGRLRLMLAKELFTFVTAAPVTQPNGTRQPVAGTNNEVERTLRGAAQARDTGRTNKTLAGARRQTIVVSVLESLRLYLPCFTLGSVVAEVERWLKTGRSCYQKLLLKLKLSVAARPVLDRVLPQPDS